MAKSQSFDAARGLSSAAVVVTIGMLTLAAENGDLERIKIWASQGVRRVTSGRPLCAAAQGGYVEVVRYLVQQMGANVNQTHHGDTPLIIAAENGFTDLVRLLVTDLGADINHGTSPLIVAARRGDLAIVRCLIELGADVGAVNSDGYTALLISALRGQYSTTQYLLEDAGANMQYANKFGNNVWDMLLEHLEDTAENHDVEAESTALSALLRIMVLRGAPPPALVALLSPELARVVQEGARLRARLPAYLAHRRAYLDSRCPRISVLPGVMRALIYGFEGPAITEELWATGLGQAP
jgi:hypothetical protein